MDEQTTSVLSSTFSFSLSVSMFDCTEKVPGECCSGGDVAFFFFVDPLFYFHSVVVVG